MSEYRKIDFSQLYKADIIFSTQRDSTISATIRAATNSAISHTMLVVDGISVIDAREDGVQVRNWKTASEGMTLAIAMRRHSLLNAADQDKVLPPPANLKIARMTNTVLPVRECTVIREIKFWQAPAAW